jgi:hypothetical protein
MVRSLRISKLIGVPNPRAASGSLSIPGLSS